MAIDFGTTYTGYAFSFHHSPSEIISNNMGRGQTRVPTIILLDASRKFHSFGDQAKAKYIELMKKNAHKDWYYFENFKMVLYNQEEVSFTSYIVRRRLVYKLKKFLLNLSCSHGGSKN